MCSDVLRCVEPRLRLKKVHRDVLGPGAERSQL